MAAPEIRTIASASASGWYAMLRLAEARVLVDAPLAERLTPVLARLSGASVVPAESLPNLAAHLAALAPGVASHRELADLALVKVVGRSGDVRTTEPLIAAIRDVEAAIAAVHPRTLDELELRARPLCEQWEARGPGLLAGVARLLGPAIVPPSLDLVLVLPVLGGGGYAHVPYNSVSFEAVLANPIAELPEVVRLAWLIAQLQLDLPVHQGELHRDALARVGPLALLPPVLAAAAEVELVSPGEGSLAAAIAAWHVPRVEPAILDSWWRTYLQTRPTWPIALAALDAMLGPAESGLSAD